MIASLFRYPLLARELTERAARKRTYIARVLYGALLYTIFVLTLGRYAGAAAADPTGLSVLGFGRELFRALVELQCWSILVLQPALMAGVITYEKERDSMPLLLLTGMSPTKMLIEKYLAGLLPMATLLLLALPAGAITMAYGGVSPQLLAAGGAVVIATWLQTGAWALLCSAWCRSTMGAMLLAFLGGALLHLAPAILFSLQERYVLWGADLRGIAVPEWLWAAWPQEAFARILAAQEGQAAGWAPMLAETLRRVLPLLAGAGVCLVLARVVLVKRASPAWRRPARVKKRAPLLASLRPQRRDLPADDPIAWRESGRSVLGRRGRFWYLAAIFAGLTFALGVFLLGLYPKTAGPERLHHLAVALGAAAVLVLVVRSVGALLAEHSNQTLDILLTTRLGAPEILRQKARALGRYSFLFGLLLSIAFGLQGWSEYEHVRANMRWRELGQYWVTCMFALVVYPQVIVWVSLLIALWLRRWTRATVASLALFGVWFIGPIVALNLAMPGWRGEPHGLWLSLLSPLGILDANEHDRLAHFATTTSAGGGFTTVTGAPWVPVSVNALAFLLIAQLARSVCMWIADARLRK